MTKCMKCGKEIGAWDRYATVMRNKEIIIGETCHEEEPNELLLCTDCVKKLKEEWLEKKEESK